MAYSQRTKKILDLARQQDFETIIPHTGAESECESDDDNEIFDDYSPLMSFPTATPVSENDACEYEPFETSSLIILQSSSEQNQEMEGETEVSEDETEAMEGETEVMEDETEAMEGETEESLVAGTSYVTTTPMDLSTRRPVSPP